MTSLFNPWKGFPAFNSVYLDPEWARMRANGQLAFGTAQEAYDAASALAGSTGKLSAIMVGVTESAVVGNIVLTSDWNPSVFIQGLGFVRSIIGLIDARNAAGNGYNVQGLYVGNVSIDGINASSIGGGGNGGIIESLILDPVFFDQIISNGNGNGNGGNINIQGIGGIVQNSTANASGAGTGGHIQFEMAFGNIGTISTVGGSGGSGGVVLGPNLQVNSVDTSNVSGGGGGDLSAGFDSTISTADVSGTTGGDVRFFPGVVITTLTNGAAPGTITAQRCSFEDTIDFVSGNARFEGVRFTTNANDNCIDDVTADGAQFINCCFKAGGTGLAIDASAPRIVISQKTLSRTEVDPNITTDGDFMVDTAIT